MRPDQIALVARAVVRLSHARNAGAAAHSSTPGRNGCIVFMRFAGAHEDDRTARTSSARRPALSARSLTSRAAHSTPHGRPMARASSSSAGTAATAARSAYTVNADGGTLRPVAPRCSKATQCLADDVPAWSPDGTQIAFVRYFLPFVKVHGEDLHRPPTSCSSPRRRSARSCAISPATRCRAIRHGHRTASSSCCPSARPPPSKHAATLDALNMLDVASGSLRR